MSPTSRHFGYKMLSCRHRVQGVLSNSGYFWTAGRKMCAISQPAAGWQQQSGLSSTVCRHRVNIESTLLPGVAELSTPCRQRVDTSATCCRVVDTVSPLCPHRAVGAATRRRPRGLNLPMICQTLKILSFCRHRVDNESTHRRQVVELSTPCRQRSTHF